MSDTCEPDHNTAANALTAFMCVGITISYLPQVSGVPDRLAKDH
ncbi:hypothetical protein VTO73DRAFT_9833 [Trametes versicolor]